MKVFIYGTEYGSNFGKNWSQYQNIRVLSFFGPIHQAHSKRSYQEEMDQKNNLIRSSNLISNPFVL